MKENVTTEVSQRSLLPSRENIHRWWIWTHQYMESKIIYLHVDLKAKMIKQ